MTFHQALTIGIALPLAGCSTTSVHSNSSSAQAPLYHKPPGVTTRWASFENPLGLKGRGGIENEGSKGHAFDSLQPGETKTLMNAEGAGMIRRIWATINPRDPRMLRSLRLNMYWDNADKPAVSVPFGDFFNVPAGRMVAFESSLFSSPEGKSFVCTIPMPFRTGARVTITNESDSPLSHLFYDIDYTQGDRHTKDTLYFHACWNRERWTNIGRDFEVLPRVRGRGRFLGCNIGVNIKPGNAGWWGEGEVKVYLDGDGQWPTLVGTGLEDYIGTGWGLKTYAQFHQGCPVADEESGVYAFYRYHVPDPVYFEEDCRVTIQQMGGGTKSEILSMMEAGVNVEPISVARSEPREFIKLLETAPVPDVAAPDFADGWINFLREDDYAATALFYLDSPTNGLPALAPLETRLEGIE